MREVRKGNGGMSQQMDPCVAEGTAAGVPMLPCTVQALTTGWSRKGKLNNQE